MKRAALVLLCLPLLTRCLQWDARLAACRDAGLCTPASATGGGSGGGDATGGGSTGGGSTGGGSTGGGSTGGGSAGGGSTGGGSTGGGVAGIARFTVTPAPLNFGAIEEDTTKDLPLTVTNTGDVPLAAPMGEPENQLLFSVVSACTAALAPDAGCTMTIRYAPIMMGQDDRRLTVSAAPAPDVIIHTLGTATMPGTRYEVLPPDLTFAPQQVLTPSPVQQVTFHNTGTPLVMLNAAVIVDTVGASDDFAIVNDLCNTTTQPNDGGCTVGVRFTPKSEGVITAELRLKPAAQADLVVPLSGTGYALTTLSVARTGIIADGGRIYSNDGGIDCPGRCTQTAPRGTVVTLRTSGLTGLAHFVEWDAGACTATAATCDVTMQPDASIASARFDPYNRVFVQTPPGNGSFKLFPTPCAQTAMAYGLTRPGTSWVFGVNDDAGTLLGALAGSRGWERIDGVPFADLPTDIISHKVISPPMIGVNGGVENTTLWTGFDIDGGRSPFNCNDWTSSNGADNGADGYTLNEALWFTNGSPLCSGNAAVLCFELGGRAPMVIPPRPPVSRLAFLSSGTVPGNTPQTAADALCNQEAGTTATNRFAALRANPAGVLAMVSYDGGTWYRPDNVRIFDQPTELGYQTKLQRVGISRFLDGGAAPARTQAWTGGDPASAYNATNACASWTATSGAGQAGFTNSVSTGAFSGLLDCGQQAHLYCFER